MNENIIEMEKINKSFEGVKVLNNVNFSLKNGEILGLVGKNGAGKSTLMKVLLAIHRPDSGIIRIKNKIVSNKENVDSRKNHISMVFQNFSLISTMSVKDNVFLNHEPRRLGLINNKFENELLCKQLKELQLDIDPNRLVSSLNTCEIQIIEIVKAIIRKRDILILDEPTASLSDDQVKKIFSLMRRLQSIGISMIFITHNIKILLEICNRVIF